MDDLVTARNESLVGDQIVLLVPVHAARCRKQVPQIVVVPEAEWDQVIHFEALEGLARPDAVQVIQACIRPLGCLDIPFRLRPFEEPFHDFRGLHLPSGYFCGQFGPAQND